LALEVKQYPKLVIRLFSISVGTRNKTVCFIQVASNSLLAAIKLFFTAAIHQKKAAVGELSPQPE
jgi:hypothetical protein